MARDDTEPTTEDLIAEAVTVAIAEEQDSRQWFLAGIRFVEAYSKEPTRDETAQTALDSTLVAVCARLRRIVQADLPRSRRER